MKKSILISGVGGSGKSTVARYLKDRGFEAYDLEDVPGLFRMVHKETGEETPDYDNGNLEMVKNHDWNLSRKNLSDLLNHQTDDIAFYSGIASNQGDIIDLFSKVIILVASPEEIRRRLSERKEGEYGHEPTVIDLQLSWKDWWEDKAKANGALVVSTDNALELVADEVLELSLRD